MIFVLPLASARAKSLRFAAKLAVWFGQSPKTPLFLSGADLYTLRFTYHILKPLTKIRGTVAVSLRRSLVLSALIAFAFPTER